MPENKSNLTIGTTTRGITIQIPLTFELLSTLKRRDLAEVTAMAEYIYAHSSRYSNPLLTEESMLDVILTAGTMITTSEAKWILKTKSFDDMLRHGRRLLADEFK